jgi:signal transduction histidine kinase/ActR/RegA family two-component response regulator
MRLPLRARLIACIGGVTTLCIVVILLFVNRFVQDRAQTEMLEGLSLAEQKLRRLHEADVRRQTRIVEKLAGDPRVHALTSLRDADRLLDAVNRVRLDAGMTSIALASATGKVRAWRGKGVMRAAATLFPAEGARAFAPGYMALMIEDVPIEFHVAPIFFEEKVRGYLALGSAIEPERLATYEKFLGCRVDLFGPEGIAVAGASPQVDVNHALRRHIAMPGEMRYRISIDRRAVLEPYRVIVRSIMGIGYGAVLLSIVVAGALASWLLRPIYRLAGTAEALRKGDLAHVAVLPGDPVLDQLTKALNGMVDELLESHSQLKERSDELARAGESQKKLETERIQSQKMEAVGRLAGGAAHDFNNLLTVVSAHCELLLLDLKQGTREFEGVQEIQAAAERGSTLTQQLLVCSRSTPQERVVFDLGQTVRDVASMLRRLIGEDVELQTTVPDEHCLVDGDPAQMEQVIMNLAINSRDAMPSGGQVSIGVDKVNVDAVAALRLDGDLREPCVRLRVTDTGCGMDDETLTRIFDPFFTTKEKGKKGTGLGLSMVYGVVKQANGAFRVRSVPGKGTTLEIYFPQSQGELEGAVATLPSASAARRSETILVVEDDQNIAELISRGLDKEGYDVVRAHSADEALDALHRHEGPIHLMVADIVMPQMSGPALAERIKAVHPGMQILYVTGYSPDAVAKYGSFTVGVDLLEKPLNPDDVLRRVGEMLAAVEG